MEPFHTGYRHHLKLGVLKIDAHAYFPLLHADKGCKVTIQPVALDRNEKTVVEALNDLAARADPCVQGRELYLIRNLARGSGVSFFDDYTYYPDFIVRLIETAPRSTSSFLTRKVSSGTGQRSGGR